MKKFFAIIILFGCFYLLKISVSENKMKEITEARYQSHGIFSSPKYQYGDLFGLCYLQDFKIKKVEHIEKPIGVDQIPRDLSLYMICDSYVFGPFNEKSDYFARVKDLHILKMKDLQWDIPKLSSNKKNVLVFEMVLRNIYNDMNLKKINSKSDFSNLSSTNNIASIQNSTDFHFNLFVTLRKWIVSLNHKILETFYHNNIETHLEFILFDFDFIMNLKMWKAEMIMRLFNRVNGAAVLSKDKKFLFMENTVINNFKGSSAYPITNDDIEDQAAKINELDAYFKSKGFDQVLFSIIPNPYDLVGSQEFGQNNQLERLLASKNLKANMLNISPKLRVNARNNFFQSDTHWNSNGATIWLTEINQYLKSIPQ